MIRHRRLVAPLVVALVASLCSLVAGVDPAGAKNGKDKKDGGGVPTPTPLGQSLYHVGITATRAGDGYWAVTDGGAVISLREASDDPLPYHYGDLSQTAVTNIVGIAAGGAAGYWLAGRDGNVHPYGYAINDYGDASANNIVGIVAAPNGCGYWLVGSDGGIFSFGPCAPFKGSLPGLNPPSIVNDVVGMASTSSGQGYWVVRSNGAIYSFGDALYHGGSPGVNDIVGMARTADNGGYWLLRAGGGIIRYGNAPDYGSGQTLCCGFTYSAIVAKGNLHDGYRLIGKNTSDFPGFEPNKAPVGTVWQNNHTGVEGCAVDPNTTTREITVRIVVDNVQRYEAPTPLYATQNPSCNYNGISGKHGFYWDIASQAPDLLDVQPHNVKVWALDSGGNPALNKLLSDTTWTSPNLNPTGAVEEISGNRVTGWASDPNTANPVTVRIYVSDPAGVFPATATATVVADLVRSDPGALNGFAWGIPASFADGKMRKVKVAALDHLTNAEVVIGDPTAGFVRLADDWTVSGGAAATWNASRWSATATNSTRTVDVANNEGRLQVISGAARATANMIPVADSDVTFTYRFGSNSVKSYLRPMLRSSGATGSSQMQTGYRVEIRSNSTTIKLQSYVNGTSAPLGDFTYNPDGVAGADSGNHRLRFHVQGSTIRVKAWPAGTPEPVSWQIDIPSDTSVVGAGVFQLNHNYSSDGGPNTVYVDDFSISSGAPPTLLACAGAGNVEASGLPTAIPRSACDLRDRVVVDNGVGGYAPPPNEELSAEAYTTTGSEELTIRTLANGTVELAGVGSERATSPATPSAPVSGGFYEPGDDRTAEDPCVGSATLDSNGVESDTRAWYLNLQGAPPILGADDVAEVEEAMLLGDRLFREGHTQCPDEMGKLNILTNYKGQTTKKAEINGSGNCANQFFVRDLTNVVSFGSLPTEDGSITLAVACRRTFFGEIVEVDMRFQTEVGWFSTLTPECSNQFDLVGVMVHETGHAYGFGHVKDGDKDDAGRFKNWTMSPKVNDFCESSARTLAGSEVQEIDQHY